MRSLEWQIDVNGLARKPIRHTLPLFASNSITRETSQVCLRQLISTNENFGNNKVFLFRIIKSNPIFPIITCRKNNESGRYYRPKLKICKPSTVNAGLISLLLDYLGAVRCSSLPFKVSIQLLMTKFWQFIRQTLSYFACGQKFAGWKETILKSMGE